jgi:hypothetical protein
MEILNASKWSRSQSFGSARVYFYDVDTGEALGVAAFMGNAEAGIWKGARYMDTRLGFSVVDLRTLAYGDVTAASFPGRRVAVKVWMPNYNSEWFALVDCAKGWQGNDADTGNIGTREIGINETMWKKTKG